MSAAADQTPASHQGPTQERPPLTLERLLSQLEQADDVVSRRIIGETIYHLGGCHAVTEVSQQLVRG